jgi:hypothetical protein
MHRGQRVEVVEAFAGQQLKAVVAWDDKYVYVCREEEYRKAEEEKREPRNIGFPREFVREVKLKNEGRQRTIR